MTAVVSPSITMKRLPCLTCSRNGQNRPQTGRFQPGINGNPRGRPKGLARSTRELIGDDGRRLVEFWLRIMEDETARTGDGSRPRDCSLIAAGGKASLQTPDAEAPLQDHELGVYRKPTRERMLDLVQLAREQGRAASRTPMRFPPPGLPFRLAGRAPTAGR